MSNPLRATLIAVALSLAPALASADDFYHLTTTSVPAPLLEAGKVNTVIEASAVEPIGDGQRFLIAHDKHPALFVVDTATGRILGDPITSPKFPQATKLGGPKWEAMSRDSVGTYYISGAHVGKSDQERAEKSVFLRFRLKDSDAPEIDDASVIRWDIARSLVSNLRAAGLGDKEVAKRKIEGLAIRETKSPDGKPRREVVFGLREPSDKVRAFAADITNTPAADAELELHPVFAFAAEPRENVASQLTTLEYVPDLNGFLVGTATEDTTNTFHGNTLYFVADGDSSHARKLYTFEVAMKLEGLAVLGVEKKGNQTQVKLLLSYDNDPHATKIPSRFQTMTLVRDAN
jgi:hypothetical protein